VSDNHLARSGGSRTASSRLRLRKGTRLDGFDYASDGCYYVTLVTARRELLFEDERFFKIVEDSWRWLAKRFPRVDLDEHVVMPNHLHGIIILNSRVVDEARQNATNPLVDSLARSKPCQPSK
jgi:hypothetical protein